MSAKNPNMACEHGHQRRKCPCCELDELQQQRDAALKLADKWESGDYGTLFSDFSNELRAIFKEKP